MSKTICPCKGCEPPRRYPSCHGKCPEYKAWNEEHQTEKLTIDTMKLCDSICDNYAIGVTEKNTRIRRIMEKFR